MRRVARWLIVGLVIAVAGPVLGQLQLEEVAETNAQAVESEGVSAVLFDQPNSGGGLGVISNFYLGSGDGVYCADDFVLTGTPGDFIELISVEGFSYTASLDPDAAWIGFRIYPNAGGVPAGQPEDGGGTEVWGHVANIGDAGLDVTDNNITLDLVAAGLGGVYLPAGTYWLTVYPALDPLSTGQQWLWYNGVDQGLEAHIVRTGSSPAPWTPLSGLGVSFSNLAFRLEGTANVSLFVVEDPYCHIIGEFGVPAGLTEPLGDMMFNNDGSVVYFVDRSEYDDSAVWSAPVIRDGGGNVTGFGSMTLLFADDYIDTGLEFAPGSTTMFYRGWGPNEAAIAQRRADGAIEYTEIYNYEAYFGGLAFVPTGYSSFGNLVSTSYYDEEMYSHMVTDDGDGTYTVADGTLFADLSGSGLADSMGDVEFVTSGYLADSLLIAFHDYVGNTISFIDLDPSTGLPAEGPTPTVHPLLTGTTEAWGIAVDPVTGYVWATMYEPTFEPYIVVIAVPVFADGFESGDNSAWLP